MIRPKEEIPSMKETKAHVPDRIPLCNIRAFVSLNASKIA